MYDLKFEVALNVCVCVISVSLYSLCPPSSDHLRLLGGWLGPGTWILSQLEIATGPTLATLITAILRHGTLIS